jgi:hypothetical protein
MVTLVIYAVSAESRRVELRTAVAAGSAATLTDSPVRKGSPPKEHLWWAKRPIFFGSHIQMDPGGFRYSLMVKWRDISMGYNYIIIYITDITGWFYIGNQPEFRTNQPRNDHLFRLDPGTDP